MNLSAVNKVGLRSCAVCGGNDFSSQNVLWSELIDAWQLSDAEVFYVNRQQGTVCCGCGCNLRSIALADALMKEYGFVGLFSDFCVKSPALRVLEINKAGGLSSFLSQVAGHQLREYPEIDMQAINEPDACFDLVIHSDTLEHVPNPVRALSECRRILKKGGKCIFTIPIIVDRFSRSRQGLPVSFHGNDLDSREDFVVHTEFGADFWKSVVEAGFKKVAIHTLEYPSAIAIVGEC